MDLDPCTCVFQGMDDEVSTIEVPERNKKDIKLIQ